MTDLPPALVSLLEGKNAEVKRHHLEARIGMLQGSRVQDVRDVLDQWVPRPGTALDALWWQVRRAIDAYADEIDAIREESYRAIPGVTDPDDQEDPPRPAVCRLMETRTCPPTGPCDGPCARYETDEPKDPA